MYFKPVLIDKILALLKRQTRRLSKPGDEAVYGPDGTTIIGVKRNGRWLWRVDHTVAICPGRGKPAVWWRELAGLIQTTIDPDCPPSVKIAHDKYDGWQQLRIRITAIRREWRVCDISEADARAEGFANRNDFLAAWDAINGVGKRNADVWCLSFEVAS